jgi:transcriptional regulator with XRE-family HTH domain
VSGPAEQGPAVGAESQPSLSVSDEELDALLIEVGQKISCLRRHRDLTQQQLARRAGCGTNTVIAVENGKRNVTVRNLAMISAAIGVQLGDLLPQSTLSGEQTMSAALAKLSEEFRIANGAFERIKGIIADLEATFPREPESSVATPPPAG